MIAPVGVQRLERGDSRLQRGAFARVGDAVVVESVEWVLSKLDCVGDVVHQRVEVVGSLYQADGEDQLRILIVAHLNRNVVLSEHIAAAEA